MRFPLSQPEQVGQPEQPKQTERSGQPDHPVQAQAEHRQFVKGQRVCDLSAPARFGKIKLVGVQVSEVEWDDGKLQYVTNRFLLAEEGQ